MKALNFAIVGCGVIALTHAKAMSQTEECHLYAVCDIIPEKADQFAADHGAEKVYYDYHELLKDPKVDVVCVCVPSGTHGEVCIAASNALALLLVDSRAAANVFSDISRRSFV